MSIDNKSNKLFPIQGLVRDSSGAETKLYHDVLAESLPEAEQTFRRFYQHLGTVMITKIPTE